MTLNRRVNLPAAAGDGAALAMMMRAQDLSPRPKQLRSRFATAGLAVSLLVGGCAAPGLQDGVATASGTGGLDCNLPTNCISSSSSGDYAALAFEGSADRAMELLRATLATFAEARLLRADGSTLETVFTTAAGFRDQVDFRVDAQRRRIDYRSRSTLGLFDFGKNRARMKEFTARFEAAARKDR